MSIRFLSSQLPKNYKILSQTIQQPINHDDLNGAYFEQRVKILIPSKVVPRPVVFLILGNEIAISDHSAVEYFNMYGKRNDMIFILAEHRGYGESVSLDEDQTIPNYVSIDQALEDYHAVVEKYRCIYHGSWIAAGYSYGGGLSINFGYRYPKDVQVILSSSGVVNWSYLNDTYESQAKKNLGRGLYERLVKHIGKLKPCRLFDRNWKDRELIYSFVSSISQYQKYNKLFLQYFSSLSYLPTTQFIGYLKLLDNIFAKGTASEYPASNSKLSLTRTEAISGKYSWRVWRYEQFNETGVLWAPSRQGLYQNSADDWAKECKLLFRENPPLLRKNKWNVKDMVDKLQIPLVYVNGGKDPWKSVCLPKNYIIKNGSYIYLEDSFHIPDQDGANGIRVINEIMKFINH